jgi:hypothetical protein
VLDLFASFSGRVPHRHVLRGSKHWLQDLAKRFQARLMPVPAKRQNAEKESESPDGQ